MSNFFKMVLAGSIGAALLSACGGGGGDSAPAAQTPVTAFALQAGYKARLASGSTVNYAITGTCTGSARGSASTPSASTFEGAAALAITATVTVSMTSCNQASGASTSITYYDANYNLLGSSTPGTNYGKFLTVPSPLPTSVKIGDTAIYGTESLYLDSSKQTSKGQRTYTYVVEKDGTSTTTAIANLILKEYDAHSNLVVTAQSRARITADGTLTPVSLDIQYSTAFSSAPPHLIYTAI